MKQIKFKDCKVGDYLILKDNDTKTRNYLMVVNKITEKKIYTAIYFDTEPYSLKKVSIKYCINDRYSKTAFEDKRWGIFRLNEGEKEEYKTKIILFNLK